jgi:hypothetical protein
VSNHDPYSDRQQPLSLITQSFRIPPQSSYAIAQDSSAAPPLMTEAMLNRLLTAAAKHGLEFAPPAGPIYDASAE